MFSAFFILKTIRSNPFKNFGLSRTSIFIKTCLPHRFISITPATTSVTAVMTIIHSEGNIQTVTIPAPNATKDIPKQFFPFFLFRFKKKYLPAMNVHHIIRGDLILRASPKTNNNLSLCDKLLRDIRTICAYDILQTQYDI